MNGLGPKIPRNMLRFLTLGVEFAAIFMVFLFAGMFLDAKFKTRPWLTLAGMVLGFAGGIYRLLRVAGQYTKDLKDKTRQK